MAEMRDEEKTQEQLIKELKEAHQRIAIFEVAERRRNLREGELRESERRYRGLFEHANDAIFIFSLEGVHLEVNQRAAEMLGYPINEIVGRPYTDFIVADEYEESIAQKSAILSGEWLSVYERTFRCKDGTTLPTEISAALVYDTEGYPSHIQSVVRDITRRKQIEGALRAGEERYRALYTTMSEGVGLYQIIYDETGEAIDYHILDVNVSYEEITGMRRDQVVGRKASEIYGGGKPVYLPTYAEVVASGRPASFETYFAPLGKHLIVSVFSPQKGQFATVFYDITERKQAEDALHKWAQIFEHAEWGTVVSSDDGVSLGLMNPAFARMHGYTVAELTGQPITSIYAPDYRADVPGHIQATNEQGHYTFESQHSRKDGSIFPVLVDVTVVKDADRNPLYRVVNVQDITERCRAEQALQESEERYRLAFLTSPDSININRVDDGMYVDINEGFSNIMGYTREEAIGKTSFDLPVWNDPNDRARLIAKLREDGYCDNLEAEFLSKEGEVKAGLMSARIITLDGAPHILSITRDITERKRLDAEARESAILRADLEKEKEIIALKERFVSMASHEFRTPLSVIQTATDLLSRYMDKLTSERQVQLLQQIEEQIFRMTDLLNDTLRISRTQVGKIKFNPSLLDLEPFCFGIFEQVQFTDQDDHQFEFSSHSHDNSVMVDAKLLQHILTNVLSNAVKYTPAKGRIQFELTVDGKQISLRIADEGIGIPKEDRLRLFEPFHRASNVGKAEGTGLGLAIVKQYVELHGGRIAVESEVGKGSTFTIMLPAVWG
jgi:PAS domain S-box-containing protein